MFVSCLLAGLLIPGSLTFTGDLITAGSWVGFEDTELEEGEVIVVEDVELGEDEVTAVEDVEFEEDEGAVEGVEFEEDEGKVCDPEEITVAAFPGAGPNAV